MRLLRKALVVGAAGAAYAFYEPYRYRLEKKVIPIARPIGELTVLHLSDTPVVVVAKALSAVSYVRARAGTSSGSGRRTQILASWRSSGVPRPGRQPLRATT